MGARVFIDGEAGTTGLQIRARLARRRDLELLSIPDRDRKDPNARADHLNRADVAILCLPDDAAREAAALVADGSTRLIDASTAHRTADGWVYGFPEMTPLQPARIAAARFVANPGCYPTGFIGLVRPLIEAGLVPADFPLTINAVSGYSGGGRKMMEAYEADSDPVDDPIRPYGLTLQHKHVPEMTFHAGLAHAPLFQPSVGNYAQGMIDMIPLQTWAMPGAPTAAQIHDVLKTHYQGSAFVSVAGLQEAAALPHLSAEALNDTNAMRLYVFANEDRQQVQLAAVYDNLGKGASGAAVQNMNIMLGCDETEGLVAAAAA